MNFLKIFKDAAFVRPLWYTWILLHAVILSLVAIYIQDKPIEVLQIWMDFVTIYTSIYIAGRTVEKVVDKTSTKKEE